MAMAITRSGILLLLVLATVHSAYAAWDNFNGVTRWNVRVSEDETRCGGQIKTKSLQAYINHIGRVAQIGDLGHGPAAGSVMGNIVTFPGRGIPDGSGTSQLSSFRLTFSADCSRFDAIYGWDYKDQYMSCSGTTSWQGTRADAPGCPWQGQAQDPTTEIKQWRSEEERLQSALAKNPKDFWANYDMAEFKKKHDNFKEYFNYLNRATSNEKVFAKTRNTLKEEARKQFGLSQYPSPDAVPLLRTAQEEVAQGGAVWNVNFPTPPADHVQRLRFMLWHSLMPNSDKIIRELASPGSSDAQ